MSTSLWLRGLRPGPRDQGSRLRSGISGRRVQVLGFCVTGSFGFVRKTKAVVSSAAEHSAVEKGTVMESDRSHDANNGAK